MMVEPNCALTLPGCHDLGLGFADSEFSTTKSSKTYYGFPGV
jgi:hypothetical protein